MAVPCAGIIVYVAMTPAEAYAAQSAAVNAQRARLQRIAPAAERWDRHAPSYRFDPHRAPDANLEILASYVEPDDDVVEVGGGAGRIGLPLALRCLSVTNVEPSAGMGAQFTACARDAGIANARLVQSTWPPAAPIEGDVVLVVDVTYFIADIVPFVRALDAAARRRVIISIWSVPPPAWNARLFSIVFGEEQMPVPGHRELLPVLWDLGLLPDVRVLPEVFSWPEAEPKTRDEAVRFAAEQLDPLDRDMAMRRVEATFDDLFSLDGLAYRPKWRPPSPGMLITWATS